MTPPCASVTSASRRKQPASPHYAGPVPFAAILLQDPINVLLFDHLDKVISARDLPELDSCGVEDACTVVVDFDRERYWLRDIRVLVR